MHAKKLVSSSEGPDKDLGALCSFRRDVPLRVGSTSAQGLERSARACPIGHACFRFLNKDGR